MVNHSIITPSLAEAIASINAITPTERIFLLGELFFSSGSSSIFPHSPLPVKDVADYQLLIIYRDKEKRPEEELQHLIEAAARKFVHITSILIPLKVFNLWLLKGHGLAHTVMQSDCLVYENASTELAFPGNYSPDALQLKVRREFSQWTERANEFMFGVKTFIEGKKYNSAAFLLHQATELSFMAAIRLVTGYRAGTHNLERMMRYAVPFCGPALNVFPRNNEKERRLFKTLQKAYIHSRYKDDFDITEDECSLLAERVKRLQLAVRALGDVLIAS